MPSGVENRPIMCTATKHAYQRAKKRLKWNPKTLDRMMPRAFEKGVKYKETKGQLKKFIDKKRAIYPHLNNPRIYGDNLFCFSNHVLITIYRLNENVLRLVRKHRQRISPKNKHNLVKFSKSSLAKSSGRRAQPNI